MQALVVIAKWELSGNGSGQRAEDDKEHGHVSTDQVWLGSGGNEFMDGDNRQNFLREEKSHALCFWQLCDLNNLLSHTLAKLSDEVRVDSENTPSTTTVNGNDRNSIISPDKKAEQTFKESVSKSFNELARGATTKQHREVKQDMRRMKKELRECDDDEEADDLKGEIKDYEKIIEKLNEDLDL